MYVIDSQPYRSSRVIVYHCLPTSAPQGELYILDKSDKIYHLPCGDLCEPVATPPEEEDDDDVVVTTPVDPVSYTYLGCYGDNSDRVLSGNFLLQYAEMTTEVSGDWA